MNYKYWVLQYVPDVARGEFTNIGVLCGRDGADWAVRFGERSIRSVGRSSDRARDLRPWITWFSRRVEHIAMLDGGEDPLSTGWLDRLQRRQSSSIRIAGPMPIDTRSAFEGVELLLPVLVEDRATPRRRSLTRRTMRVEVRDVLTQGLNLTLGETLFERPRAAVGKQRGGFDFLQRLDGSEALANVWAFNVTDLELLERELQASNYFLTRVRDSGAQILNGPSTRFEVPNDVPIEVIIDRPALPNDPGRRLEIFEAAQEAWSLNRVAVRDFKDFRSSVALLS